MDSIGTLGDQIFGLCPGVRKCSRSFVGVWSSVCPDCARVVKPPCPLREARSMATISRRRGQWRVQVRRGPHALSKTFALRSDAETWARECERSIDMDVDPTARRFTSKDRFAALIDTHIEGTGSPHR